ncbi:hypothetical protein ACWEN3_26010, partial [Streptomyces sp. NPDC004561]
MRGGPDQPGRLADEDLVGSSPRGRGRPARPTDTIVAVRRTAAPRADALLKSEVAAEPGVSID